METACYVTTPGCAGQSGFAKHVAWRNYPAFGFIEADTAILPLYLEAVAG